jgi:nucleotide-binding universal stress UspA family protein
MTMWSYPAGVPVVVGADGSDSSLAAVRLAARLAAERDRPLRVVHAFIWPQLHVPLGPSPEGPPEGGFSNAAARIVADAVAEATRAEPKIGVTGEVIEGSASPVLLSEAANAAMVVIGDRGLGGFTGLLVGSVAIQVAAHARCPVVVMRGDSRPDRDILVGVEGRREEDAALAFAFDEAARRGAGVRALHAFTHPTATEPGDMLPLVYSADDLQTEESTVLAEALAGWQERYPEVPVTRLVVRGRPGKALIGVTDEAAMAVVGSRGRGGFAGLMLGSVSQALLHHAACPVVIAR